ncbi:MAG: hypothetical protein HY023_14385, partial [Chloroflexi bacterium]|nr:hypothetical protein [Chloroflexota bacterium]
GTTGPEARAQMLIDYLAPRTDDTFYLVATLNARDASPLIIETGRPVLTFGGFSGGDQVIDAEGVADLVSAGRLRYIWVAPQEMQRQHTDLLKWIEGNCQVEAWPEAEQLAGPPNGPGGGPGDAPRQLYSCGPTAS